MRLFAGIELDAATRDSCAHVQDRLRAAHFDARHEPPESCTSRLHFSGVSNQVNWRPSRARSTR